MEEIVNKQIFIYDNRLVDVAEDGVRVRNINPEISSRGICHHHGRVPMVRVNRTEVMPSPKSKSELDLNDRDFLSFHPIKWFVENCGFESHHLFGYHFNKFIWT